MDVRPPAINLYRYNFQDLLLESSRARIAKTGVISDPLIAQVFVSRSHANSSPRAPQGIGENKHAATRTADSAELENTGETVQQVTEKDDSWLPDSAFHYNAARGYFRPPLAVRQRMESEVRKRKKAGLPCMFADNNFHCSALFIRCGDRIQYANPESLEQKNMPHTCLYRPRRAGKYILIVDNNKAVRDFCRNSIELFFNYSGNNIVTAGSGYEAIEQLNRFKVEGKQCGLLICDTNLPGLSGFEVVNELYNRNYNTEVILTREEHATQQVPKNFKGLREIIPEKAVVEKIISKPFHSQIFINALKSMDINHLFEE